MRKLGEVSRIYPENILTVTGIINARLASDEQKENMYLGFVWSHTGE